MIKRYPGLVDAVNHGTFALSGELVDFAMIGACNFGTVIVADAAPDLPQPLVRAAGGLPQRPRRHDRNVRRQRRHPGLYCNSNITVI